MDCDILVTSPFMEFVKDSLGDDSFICSLNVKRTNVLLDGTYIDLEMAMREPLPWIADKPDYKLAIGGLQVFPVEFAMRNRGYYEELNYWNGVDYYMWLMAREDGMDIMTCDEPILHLNHTKTKIKILEDIREKTMADIIVKNRGTLVQELVLSCVKNGDQWGLKS